MSMFVRGAFQKICSRSQQRIEEQASTKMELFQKKDLPDESNCPFAKFLPLIDPILKKEFRVKATPQEKIDAFKNYQHIETPDILFMPFLDEYLSVLDVYIKVGGNMNIFDEKGLTILHMLVIQPYSPKIGKALSLVLEAHNLNINQQEKHGNTALHLATLYRTVEAVELILTKLSEVSFNTDKDSGFEEVDTKKLKLNIHIKNELEKTAFELANEEAAKMESEKYCPFEKKEAIAKIISLLKKHGAAATQQACIIS